MLHRNIPFYEHLRESNNCNLSLSYALFLIWYIILQLTLSLRRTLSYGSQSIDLDSKSMDWFLYSKDLRHESVNKNVTIFEFLILLVHSQHLLVQDQQ